MEPTIMEAGMELTLERWAGRLFLGAVFLFPLVVIPLTWFPFLLLKISLFSVLLLVACLLSIYASYTRGGFSLPRDFALLAVLALPLAYLISAGLSQNKLLSFVGSGGEVNTVFFAVLCALAVFASGVIVRSRAQVRSVVMALFYSLVAIAIFQLLQATTGFASHIGLSIFSTPSTNVVGKWNDLGILMGALAVLAMVSLDSGTLRIRMRSIMAGAFVLALAMLALINLDTAWQVLAGTALVSAALTIFSRSSADALAPLRRKVPVAALIVLVISAVFIAWGTQINTQIAKVVPVSELEVRPAISTTRDIAISTYKQSPRTVLFGTGPGTFVEQWLMYKPTAVNSTQFWNLDFAGGSGVIPTAFVTTGIVGGLVWVILIALLLMVLYRSAKHGGADPSTRTLVHVATLGALFILVSSALYLSGGVVLLAGFILVGAALSGDRLLTMKEWVFPLKHAPGSSTWLAWVIIALFGVSSLAIAGYSGQRFISAAYTGRALVAQSSDRTVAKQEAQKALAVYYSEDTLRLLANIALLDAQAISNENKNGAPSPDQSTRFQASFAEAMKYAQDAIALNPRNYQNRVAAAQLFEALIPLKVTGAYDNAKQNYKEAIRLNPYNPGLFLSAARVEAQGGSEADFKSAIQTAFSLKPNFTEAALLVLQVEIARNNIDGAILAAQVAAATAPQNPGIYFELGLLKYVKGDAPGARDGFEMALKLAPDYANAKYFLGLTYNRLGRTQEGIALFEDLQKSNPTNTEVALILANMKAGKDPFASAQPPITPNPEDRKTPPIAE